MRYFLFSVIFFSFYSCKQHKRPDITFFNCNGFVLADTSYPADKYFVYGQAEEQFPIYFLGYPQDTICIGSEYRRGKTKWKHDIKTMRIKKWDTKHLNIYVDTSVKTTETIYYVTKDWRVIADSAMHYKAYLLTIKNICDTAISLGKSFSLLFLSREIKNKFGRWINPDSAISKEICGTGQPTIILKPRQILLSKVGSYSGAILTDCRFAFGVDGNMSYSNTYKDYVDARLYNP